jgi:hypothetical protein
VHFDLRNYKELYLLPNHVPKDMRKKGWIDFNLKSRSNLRKYLQERNLIAPEEHIEVNGEVNKN